MGVRLSDAIMYKIDDATALPSLDRLLDSLKSKGGLTFFRLSHVLNANRHPFRCSGLGSIVHGGSWRDSTMA